MAGRTTALGDDQRDVVGERERNGAIYDRRRLVARQRHMFERERIQSQRGCLFWRDFRKKCCFGWIDDASLRDLHTKHAVGDVL
jgi:hypothetical protein